MTDFSRYLGKDERVLDTINMKDETIWKKGNVATAEWKSWMTMIVTNKRIFSVNKRKLNFMEIRHDDIVTTGWEHYPSWGHAVKAAAGLILAAAAASAVWWAAPGIAAALAGMSFPASVITLSNIRIVLLCLAALLLAWSLMHGIIYFGYRRTALVLSARDGKTYRFLLRGTSRKIDEFRMAIQEAKDISIEEAEGRYFNNMNRVMINQVNYQKALEQREREMLARGEEVNYIPGRETVSLDGQAAPGLGTASKEQIAAPGEKKAIDAPGEKKMIDAPGDPVLIEAETRGPDSSS